MRIKSTFGFTAVKYGTQVIAVIKGIYIANVLGPGLYGVLGSILLIRTLADYFGAIPSSGLNVAVSTNSKNNSISTDSYYSNALFQILLFATLAATSLWLLSLTNILSGIYLAKYTGVLALLVGVGYLKNFVFVNLRLSSQFNKLSVQNLLSSLMALLFTVLLIKKHGVLGVLYSSLIAEISASLIFCFFLPRKFSALSLKVNVALFSIGMPLVFTQITGWLIQSIDKWFILTFFSKQQMGYYVFASMLCLNTAMLFRSIYYLYNPRILRMFSKTYFSKEKMLGRFLVICRYSEAVVVVLAAAGLAVLPYCIKIILPKYAESIPLFNILLISSVFNLVSLIPSSYIAANYQQKKLIPIQLGTLVFAAMLNYSALKMGFGVSGIVISTLVASIVNWLMKTYVALSNLSASLWVNSIKTGGRLGVVTCLFLWLIHLNIPLLALFAVVLYLFDMLSVVNVLRRKAPLFNV